jgi:serine protease Do
MFYFRILTAFVAFFCSLSVGFAESSGKKTISKLFAAPASKATAATVRVRCDNKDTVLGTVMDRKGLILTKGSELRGTISVRLADGTDNDAKLLGYHEPTDLALLSIEGADLSELPKLAESKDAKVGNWIAVTTLDPEPIAVGVVSAGNRRLYMEENVIDNLNKGFLGISALGSESGDADGVVIGSVEPGGGAAMAKLKRGDVILSVAGKSVKQFEDMKKILDKYKPGDTVKILIRREEVEKEYSVRLVKKAQFDRGALQNTLAGDLSARRTGFPSVIMHDAAIKPSDCGGPLVDLDGNILGINIARAGRVETWTLPAEVIKPVFADLKAGKYAAAKDDKK